MIICKHLLCDYSLIFDIDGIGGNVVDDYSVGRHNKLRILP